MLYATFSGYLYDRKAEKAYAMVDNIEVNRYGHIMNIGEVAELTAKYEYKNDVQKHWNSNVIFLYLNISSIDKFGRRHEVIVDDKIFKDDDIISFNKSSKCKYLLEIPKPLSLKNEYTVRIKYSTLPKAGLFQNQLTLGQEKKLII